MLIYFNFFLQYIPRAVNLAAAPVHSKTCAGYPKAEKSSGNSEKWYITALPDGNISVTQIPCRVRLG